MIETTAPAVPAVFLDLFDGSGQPPVEEADRPEREPHAGSSWSRINVFLVGVVAALGVVYAILEVHRLAF